MKYKLGDICEEIREKILTSDLSEQEYISTDNMIVNRGGVIDAVSLPSSKKVQSFKCGDVLVSNIRPYFKKIWHATFEGGCSNDVLVFRAKQGVSGKFLYYTLSDDAFFSYATSTAKGTKMPRGDKEAIMEYPVDLPSYELQEKRVILPCLFDELINYSSQINKNLEELAQTYFDKLFIIDADIKWQKCTLSDLGMIVSGGTPSKSHPEYYAEEGIPWITPKDLAVNKSKFISHGVKDISELGYLKSSATKIPAGTVLFSSRAPIGYISIAQNEVTTNQGFKSIIPKKNIGTAYIYFLLKSLLPTIEGMASGSTFKEISGAGMKSVPTILPAKNILEQFNNFCEPIFKKQEILEAESRRLTALRDSLLPKLMSGELDISSID